MNILKEFSVDSKCSYLPNKNQSTYYKIISECSLSYCEELIELGYRRFGKMYFRPICFDCDECKSIKIDVQNFHFSKSQRRVIRKASNIKSYIQKPTISKTHLELFEKYHLFMKDKKGWEYSASSVQSYYNSFVDAHNEFGYEVLYYIDNTLIGVDLIDILQNGVSSIYFYYDPDYEQYSLGKLSLYNQIMFAKKSQKKWIYLGYYVQECQSLSYKSQYKPYLTLQGRPDIYENPIWQ
ncbi:MAG: arginyltransferase [Sulfurimonas sp. RIFOXYD12_FULL_33_39]|uniref:arginyltransferase n=1 Tax=unclassified Sulfurimonas TaxID=2623549 RepID=UPI0008C38D65|nr:MULTISPECIES: arginyltransferase [unclassified Sulfurimonas]OHE06692.1 MAG: arginyltransferase [Sulfurimonas sp. RIFCSPLOWO2_12_FULL_34_6]OHE10428.1 MAG: arginyltransferase [Sulfurimonas sp. RIFOXYD12_FULL_33_39]OHE14886.1 MAG: arginyltransferase [Sulfurimonas sp. RIFOXYD2_FULL_34_21]